MPDPNVRATPSEVELANAGMTDPARAYAKQFMHVDKEKANANSFPLTHLAT